MEVSTMADLGLEYVFLYYLGLELLRAERQDHIGIRKTLKAYLSTNTSQHTKRRATVPVRNVQVLSSKTHTQRWCVIVVSFLFKFVC